MLLLFLLMSAAAVPLTRERTLVVTRHGIRVPFPPFDGMPIDIFSKDSTRDWFTVHALRL